MEIGRTHLYRRTKGQDRAEYGAYLLQNVALEIEKEFGSGFSVRQLERARQFYRTYPIATALRTQLNWYQYRLLIQIDDKDKREYYELEATNNNWTGRELERQINSGLYERLLLSNDKKAVLEVARKERIPESPTEIIKDPMVLEFLGLRPEATYYEKRFGACVDYQSSSVSVGVGQRFFVCSPPKRILLEDDEFFADLVFYNRLLRCFVVIELKTHKITHEDIGQLQMYVNYYDRNEKAPTKTRRSGFCYVPIKTIRW